VLRIPAKPPVKDGSGLLGYPREPKNVDPSKTEIVVPVANVTLLAKEKPYPNVVVGYGNNIVKFPRAVAKPLVINAGGSILFESPGPPPMTMAPRS
jgi:hypothetical protein